MRRSNRGLAWRIAVALGLLQLAGGAAATAGRPDSDGPAAAFAEGRRLFQAGDYLGAVESFDRAYQLRPHYSVQCNVALCFERQGDFVQAAVRYRRCLDGGGRHGGNGAAIANSLARSEARISVCEVRSAGGGVVYLDGKARGPAPTRLSLNPGVHVIEVRRRGAESATDTVTTRGGEQLTLTLEPRDSRHGSTASASAGATAGAAGRRDERSGLSSAWFWSMLSVTAALATAATVLGLQTLSLKSDFEAAPTAERRDRGLSRRLATNAVLGAAAAAAAATTTLFFFTDFRGRERGAPAAVVGDARNLVLGFGLCGSF